MKAVAISERGVGLLHEYGEERVSGPASSLRAKYLPDRRVLDDAHEFAWWLRG